MVGKNNVFKKIHTVHGKDRVLRLLITVIFVSGYLEIYRQSEFRIDRIKSEFFLILILSINAQFLLTEYVQKKKRNLYMDFFNKF